MLAHIMIQCFSFCAFRCFHLSRHPSTKKYNKHINTCLHGIHSNAYVKGWLFVTQPVAKCDACGKGGTGFEP